MNTAKTTSIEEERKKNLEDTIKWARWNAEMVKRLGRKWFEIRDKWLQEAFEKDKQTWKNPKTREALIKAILRKT